MAVLAWAITGVAQVDERARLLDERLTRIFTTRDFAVPGFGPARWMPDGTSYTSVEAATPPATGWDIVRYDAATGDRRVMVGGIRLTAPGQSEPLPIDDYVWSSDGTRLLVFTNTRKVWRDNTRGDYWVMDVNGGTPRKLGGPAPEASLMFAKFSPDGTRVAYVRANDIYVERLSDGRIRQVTSGGSATTINGTSDWVYEEELGLRDAFRWSPDGRSLAYWQFDSTGVGDFALINNTDTLYPAITRIPYPKAGTTNSAVRIGVVSADGGRTRWMQTPGDPRNTYLARMDWMDANTLVIQQLNRLQNQNDVLLADTKNGRVSRVFSDTSEGWVDVVDDTPWLDNGRSFLWISERSGWRHAYKVPVENPPSLARNADELRRASPRTSEPSNPRTRTGEPENPRTGEPASLFPSFSADLTNLVGVDEESGWLYFLASPTAPTERYLYRSRLDGTGTPERVTPNDQPGTHTYVMAPGAKMAFHTWSRFDVPPVIDVVDIPSHTRRRALTDTTAVMERLKPVLEPPVEFFTIDAGDGVTMDGWMLKPSSFDPSRRYPVIVYVYGEPASQTVTDRWGGARMLFHRALAEAGYLIVSVDNRGTPSPKGKAWRQVVYGAVGDLAAKEQASAVRALAARHSFIDLARVGIWGWSGGGSNTLLAMFRQPDVFGVGVSVAPVPDKALYDTIYQERYMGLPQDNVEGYRLSSPVNFAEGLTGRLLLIHGSGDDNVHYQGTERLMNRLIELGKPFDVMVYPNRTHAIAEGPGTTIDVHRRIARYFLDHLPAGAR